MSKAEPSKSAQLAMALTVDELERAYLAEFIHDDVLQLLGTALLAAETCEQAWHRGRVELLPDHLAHLREVLEQSVQQLRQLMVELRPYRPDGGGLEEALQGVFRAYSQRNQGTVTFRLDAPHPLSSTAEALAYRLILETVRCAQNLHQPSDIHLALRARAGRMELEAAFQPVDGQSAAGNLLDSRGLALLRWRTQALDGVFSQKPLSGTGVQLRIRLPLPT